MYVRLWPRISASSRTPPRDRPHELATGASRDALRQRCLADAGRADQTQHGPLELLHERLHREILDDALLGLLEAVVILLEDLLRRVDVVVLFALVAPGKRKHPVDVVADDRGLRAHRLHHLELLELLAGFEVRLLGELLLLELRLELLNLALELVALAELLLNGLHLLIQVVLLLRLLHLLLDAGADLHLDLEDLDFGVHQLEQPLQSLGRVDGLENLLAVRELDARQVHDHRVGKLRRVVDGLHRHQHLGRCAC